MVSVNPADNTGGVNDSRGTAFKKMIAQQKEYINCIYNFGGDGNDPTKIDSRHEKESLASHLSQLKTWFNGVKEKFSSEEIKEVEEDKTEVSLLTYYQFVKLVERARENGLLDETLWKRIDKIESTVQGMDATYRVSNKLWQRIEKYVSTFLLAGGEPEEALDNVMAHHVINTMAQSVAKGGNKTGEKFSHIIENIFGEGHVPLTVKAVKSTGYKI